MNIQYAKLYAKNPDTVGWLHIDNTGIDTVVVQRRDDTVDYQYYLKHDFFGKDNKYGNPFMEFAADAVDLSDNTVIHGHNMFDGLMFADLENYLTLDGLKNSPIIEFNTLYRSYKWKVFAVLITNGGKEGDNGYLFNFTETQFLSPEKKKTFIEAIRERSLYDTGIDVNENDKLLTLNTCCYVFDDARIGVVARLLREGESEQTDTAAYTNRTDVRYPQAWYDAKGLSNPYRDAPRWVPTED